MKKFLWLPLLLIVLAACSSKVPHEKTAAEYFQEGEQYFDDGQYNDAIKSWEKVREIFYSPELNMLAELKIAEAHFLNKDYVDVITSYSIHYTKLYESISRICASAFSCSRAPTSVSLSDSSPIDGSCGKIQT